MKIGVISDTHSLEIPKQVLKAFEEVDFIIHAGDFCAVDDLNILTDIKEVKAVYGNMDESKIVTKFPQRQIFSFGKFLIGLYHGEGPPKRVLDFVVREFEGEKVDAVIFGHSHYPLIKKVNNVLYFNPGSPNDTIRAPYCSYGILEIINDELVAKIIKLG